MYIDDWWVQVEQRPQRQGGYLKLECNSQRRFFLFFSFDVIAPPAGLFHQESHWPSGSFQWARAPRPLSQLLSLCGLEHSPFSHPFQYLPKLPCPLQFSQITPILNFHTYLCGFLHSFPFNVYTHMDFFFKTKTGVLFYCHRPKS